MNVQRDQISSLHLGLIIISAQIGAGIITFPEQFTKQTGHHGWISIVLTGLLATGACWIIGTLLNRYQDRSIYEINDCLFGKWLGRIINCGLLFYLIGITASCMREFAIFIQLFMLTNLPPPLVMTLILLPTFFLTKNGLRAVGRFSYFLLVILGGVLLLASLQFSNIRMTYYQPIIPNEWNGVISAVPVVFYTYIGLELTAFLFPAVRDRKQAIKWTMLANLFSMLFFTILYLVSIGVFGEAVLPRLVAPIFSLSRTLKLPLIERVDLFFFLLWFPLLESSVRSFFAAAFDGLRRLFPVKNSYPTLTLFTIGLILGSLIFIPGDLTEVFQIGKLNTYAGIGVTGYLIACFILSFILKKGIPT